jgi:hypothetical protein
MRALVLMLVVACGGANSSAALDAGTLSWACEYPRCCERRSSDNACIDFGCCDDDGWRFAP